MEREPRDLRCAAFGEPLYQGTMAAARRRVARRRATEAVTVTAAAAAVIFAAVPALGGVSGSRGPRTAAGEGLAHPVIAYVAVAGPGWVIPIRTATSTPLPPIKTGPGADFIAITPDGKTAYVANGNPGTVSPIRTATNQSRPHSRRHRDHPGREDRLRDQLRFRHGDADPDRHQHRPATGQDRPPPQRHRDHPGREDRLRGQQRFGHRDA